MKKLALIIALLLQVSSCVMVTKPSDDLGFAQAENLPQFNGCYQNCSNPSDGSALMCLSNNLWSEEFDHEAFPDEIYVEAKNDSQLAVTAYKQGEAGIQSIFTKDEHFYFRKGRIELKRDYIGSAATGSGNVFIGIGGSKTRLGIDSQYEARVEQSTFFAGTVFLLIPLAISGLEVSKIKRVGDKCSPG